MDGQTKSAWVAVAKACLMLVFLPLTLIWVVWKKTSWKKQNKWVATVVIAVVFLFIMGAFSSGKQPVRNEIASPQTQIVAPQKQPATEEPGNISAPVTQNQNEEIFKVDRAVDGDTIKLADGQVVRLIGIDSPETVAPEKPVQCFGKEASEKAKEMLEGKDVKLIKDVSETDKYNRILRYAYVGEIFVNDYLVRNGFAKAYNFPPDEKFKAQFLEAQTEAKINKRGLWADNACAVPAPVPAPIPAPKVVPAPVIDPVVNTSSSFACNCSKTCPQMGCAEAQYQLNSCGCSRRDADHDGVACDADCQ